MEDYLDVIAKGDKQYYELCSSCAKEIDSINSTVNTSNREDIKIDTNHTFMIGKHGPVIKKNNNGKTEFISVKKDINIDKLKNGNYKLEEIIEDNTLDKILGKYQNNNILLKKGKFGLYITWGENKKSINDININENDIKLEDVMHYITNSKNNTNILRDISKDISIRKGQYGHYIFYKTSNMNKPRFIKLNDFKEDYLNCDVNLIISFVKEKIK